MSLGLKIGGAAVLLGALCTWGCSSDPDGKSSDVLLAADPPSLIQGQKMSVTIRASEPFFSEDVSASVEGASGLSVESITVGAPKEAIAEIEVETDAPTGRHLITLDADGTLATFEIGVLAAEQGPGSVAAEGNEATAGAHGAMMVINGVGTHFDSKTTVSVEGADGFDVVDHTVRTSNRIDVSFRIDLNQESTVAQIVVVDGDYRYSVPFFITSPARYESEMPKQSLVKGEAGWIVFAHREATLSSGTRVYCEDEQVETGPPEVIGSEQVSIPVRVPFDYEQETIELVARTYSQAGAKLEMMTASVSLLDPAYLTLSPCRVSRESESEELLLKGYGVDPLDFESIEVDDGDGLAVVEWTKNGDAEIALADGPSEQAALLVVSDGDREFHVPFWVTENKGAEVYPAVIDVGRGDRQFASFALKGEDFSANTAGMTSDDEEWVGVHQFSVLGPGFGVAEIEVDKESPAGLKRLLLSTGVSEHEVLINVVANGL